MGHYESVETPSNEVSGKDQSKVIKKKQRKRGDKKRQYVTRNRFREKRV